MKVKLDENITTAAKALIEQHGHDVDTVADEGPHRCHATPVVIEACRSDERMLVTFDVGFGNLRAYPPGTPNGIVLLRSRGPTPRCHARCASPLPDRTRARRACWRARRRLRRSRSDPQIRALTTIALMVVYRRTHCRFRC